MKHDLEWGTQKNYFTTQKYVEMFLKRKFKRSDIYLRELGYVFIKDFERFLKSYQPTDHHKPMGQNTVMKHIERLRKIIHLAIREEMLEKDPFQKFRAKFKQVKRGYLTTGELQRIEKKEFPLERLQLVKDLFIFSCYTGLSYAEVYDLEKKHLIIGIDGRQWIEGQRRKSREFFAVPLLPQANHIIEKYRNDPRARSVGKLLPVLTNQKLNAYLKEIADLCGIEKNLTFHLARHTFATTVTLANGVPIETVGKMLGHASLRSTQIYAQVVRAKVSEDMDILKNKLSIKSDEGKEHTKSKIS
jgi:site-specific recombinase XerD